MVDTITGTGDLTNFVQTVHDRMLRFALRSVPQHDMVADVKPAHQAMPGTTVTFHIMSDLSPATTELTEEADVDRVVLASTTTTVAVKEYGNVVGLTAKLRATGLVDVDEAAANVLAYNLVDSVDVLARDILVAGTNVRYSGDATSRTTLGTAATADSITASDLRFVAAKMRGANVLPKKQGLYVAFMHPDVSYDLRSSTGAGTWRDSHIYASPQAIYAGEIGALEGVAVIETPRAKIFADVSDGAGGAGNIDAYITLVLGQEALAKAVAIEPHMVQSPVVDRLRRLPSWGWYTLENWGRFREAALYRIESISTIGTNT